MKKLLSFFNNKIFKFFIIFLLLGFGLTFLMLFISNRYDLLGWTNAISFTAILLLALFWLTYANNQGVFDILSFGLKSFVNGFRKDYKKLDYLEYKDSKDKVGKEYYIALSIVIGLFLIPTIILTVLLS